MANFLKRMIENDKKELKRLSGIADKVEEFSGDMENCRMGNYVARPKNLEGVTKLEKHWMIYFQKLLR